MNIEVATRAEIDEFTYRLKECNLSLPRNMKLSAVVDYADLGVPEEMNNMKDIEYRNNTGIIVHISKLT